MLYTRPGSPLGSSRFQHCDRGGTRFPAGTEDPVVPGGSLERHVRRPSRFAAPRALHAQRGRRVGAARRRPPPPRRLRAVRGGDPRPLEPRRRGPRGRPGLRPRARRPGAARLAAGEARPERPRGGAAAPRRAAGAGARPAARAGGGRAALPHAGRLQPADGGEPPDAGAGGRHGVGRSGGDGGRAPGRPPAWGLSRRQPPGAGLELSRQRAASGGGPGGSGSGAGRGRQGARGGRGRPRPRRAAGASGPAAGRAGAARRRGVRARPRAGPLPCPGRAAPGGAGADPRRGGAQPGGGRRGGAGVARAAAGGAGPPRRGARARSRGFRVPAPGRAARGGRRERGGPGLAPACPRALRAAGGRPQPRPAAPPGGLPGGGPGLAGGRGGGVPGGHAGVAARRPRPGGGPGAPRPRPAVCAAGAVPGPGAPRRGAVPHLPGARRGPERHHGPAVLPPAGGDRLRHAGGAPRGGALSGGFAEGAAGGGAGVRRRRAPRPRWRRRVCLDRPSLALLRHRHVQALQELLVVLDAQLAAALLDEGVFEELQLVLEKGGAGLLAAGGVRFRSPALVVRHLEEHGALGVGHGAAGLAGGQGHDGPGQLGVVADAGDRALAAELGSLLDLHAQLRGHLVQRLAGGELLAGGLELLHGELLLLLALDRRLHPRLDVLQLGRAGGGDVLQIEDGPALRELHRLRDLALLEAGGRGAEAGVAADAGDDVLGAELAGLGEGDAGVLRGKRLEVAGAARLVAGQAGGEVLGLGGGEVARPLGGEAGADHLPGLLERLRAAGLLVEDLDQVVAEAGLDRAHQLVERGVEGRVLELLDHAVAAEGAEVAAVGLGGRVVGVLGGHLGEVGAALDLLLRLLDARLSLGVGALVVDLHQDVPGVDLLLVREIGLVRVVEALEVLIGHLDVAGGAVAVDEQVGDVALLRQAELRLVGLEVGGEIGRRGLDLGGEAAAGDLEVADLGLLHLVAVGLLDLVLADVEVGRQGGGELLHQQLVPQVALELPGGEPVGLEPPDVLVLADEAPLLVLEDFEDLVAQLGVGDGEPQAARLGEEDLLADQLVEGLERQPHLLGQLGSELVAVHLVEPVVLALVGALELRRRHPLAADRGGDVLALVRLPDVAAELHGQRQDEEGDDRPEDPGEVLQIVTKHLEHGKDSLGAGHFSSGAAGRQPGGLKGSPPLKSRVILTFR